MLETRFDQNPRETKMREYEGALVEEVREVAESGANEMRGILGASTTGIATRNTQAGELVISDGAVYRAIVNIPDGAALVEGMNVVRTSVEEQLNLLQEG